jgi:transcriptional regulator with XRE-family HTH domain
MSDESQPQTPERKFAVYVKTRREHQRLTKAKLAELVGLTRQDIDAFERGRRSLTLNEAWAIHRALQNDLTHLNTSPPEPPGDFLP